jgi:hypothetical protein
MRNHIILAVVGFLALGVSAGGFMHKAQEAANAMFNEEQKQYIDGVPVYPVNETAASQINYYDWQNQMSWSDMGVQTYNYT